ncbi:MAG: hypothetical protein ACRD3W_21580 [Terriglobales bacterium]
MSDCRRSGGFFARLFGRRPPRPTGRPKLLILVEGSHDVSFLTGISSILHRGDAFLPDLRALEQAGEIVFVPVGGGDVIAWASRFAPLGLLEVHILDRETFPTTETRQRAASIVNQRPNCRAFVTAKRALENYLHPKCLFEARGIEIAFGDEDDVPAIAARECHRQTTGESAWEMLSGRARKRCRERAKRWLNQDAVARMTVKRLAAQDPQGEIRSWLLAIAQLARHSR